MFTRNYRLVTALSPRLDSLMRRPHLRRALLRQVVAYGERIPPAAAARMVRDSIGCQIYFDLTDAIQRDGTPAAFDQITCPVLLAWGTRDRIPAHSPLLTTATGDAPERRVGGATATRALTHVRRPRLVARTIVEFVGRVREPAIRPA
jgi:pimeloyl-ACP methyl ester carboxylesterase